MNIDKITTQIYFEDIADFIKVGWAMVLKDKYVPSEDDAPSLDDEYISTKVITDASAIYKGCLHLHSIYGDAVQRNNMVFDVYQAAAVFCDAWKYCKVFHQTPSFSHLYALSHLSDILLEPKKIKVTETQWWPMFRSCLAFCKGHENPIKNVNFGSAIVEPPVTFMLAYQLHKRGVTWPS